MSIEGHIDLINGHDDARNAKRKRFENGDHVNGNGSILDYGYHVETAEPDAATHVQLEAGKTLRFGVLENEVITVDDWINRWETQNGGRWQIKNVNPLLTKHVSSLLGWFDHSTHRRILVPLSGKSVDLIWLAKQARPNLTVIGIEGADKPTIDLFRENNIPSYSYSLVVTNNDQSKTIAKYEALDGKLIVFRGDFFSPKLNADLIGGPVDYIWDRTGMNAIHTAQHPEYVAKLHSFLNPQHVSASSRGGFQYLFSQYWHDQVRGPPFPINQAHLATVFQPLGKGYTFQVIPLDEVDASYDGWKNGGFDTIVERIHGIKLVPTSNANGSAVSASVALASCSPQYARTFTSTTSTAGVGTHSSWTVDGLALQIDAAKAFGGQGQGVGPLPTNLSTLAACQQITANVVLSQGEWKGKSIASWQWQVKGYLHSQLLETGTPVDIDCGCGSEGTFHKVELVAIVKTKDITQQEVPALIAEVERRCPLAVLYKRAGVELINRWIVTK